MSRFNEIGFVLAAAIAMAATASHAQVAMYGQYGESNGIIVNIPQNPLVRNCIPPVQPNVYPPHATIMGAVILPSFIDVRGSGTNDARCHGRNTEFANSKRLKASVFNKPQRGVYGFVAGVNGGLNVGDPFTVPPFAFQQQLGKQVGIVLNSAVRQLDTTFIAAMPGTNRISGMQPKIKGVQFPDGPYTVRPKAAQIPVPALTRRFSQMNWNNPGNGQNNGANPTTMLNTPFQKRGAANTTYNSDLDTKVNLAAEKIRMRYIAGPREFGGTMALLLDGAGILWQAGPGLDFRPGITALMRKNAATQPVGDQVPGFRVRNAAGWNIIQEGFQASGKQRAFFTAFNAANLLTPMGAKRISDPCTFDDPPTPAGCNQINGWTTWMVGAATQAQFGAGGKNVLLGTRGTLRVIPKATSRKHAFPLTTGTVSLVRVADRTAFAGGVQTQTMTGMGYDTTMLAPNGQPQRNVGLVAGSFSVRSDFLGTVINSQMLGVDLRFAPEPAASAALVSGLGLLAALAYRRRNV